MSATPSTIAVLTPPGKGALATLALAGPGTWAAVRALFRPRRGQLPEVPPTGRYWLGRIGDDSADDAVLAVPRAGCVEVHVHGGREVPRWLTELFAARGLEVVAWPHYAARTGQCRLDSLLAVELARATTVRTAAIVLDQATGTLRRALEGLLAHLEAGRRQEYEHDLARLRRWRDLGEHLSRPWRVVLAGAPNVGKSSLLNALAGYQRSIVAPTPGTTRDVVTATLAIDGWPVEVCDTAGLRESAENLEGEGIALARDTAAEADLCLWLLDATAAPYFPPAAPARECNQAQGLQPLGSVGHAGFTPTQGLQPLGLWGRGEQVVHLLVNKIDQPPVWDLARAGDALHVSAVTGQGLAELSAAISRWLVPEAPAPGTAVPLPGMDDLADPEKARAVLRSLLGV